MPESNDGPGDGPDHADSTLYGQGAGAMAYVMVQCLPLSPSRAAEQCVLHLKILGSFVQLLLSTTQAAMLLSPFPLFWALAETCRDCVRFLLVAWAAEGIANLGLSWPTCECNAAVREILRITNTRITTRRQRRAWRSPTA